MMPRRCRYRRRVNRRVARTAAQSTCSICRSTSGNYPFTTSVAMVWHACFKRAATTRDLPPWRSDRRRRGVFNGDDG